MDNDSINMLVLTTAFKKKKIKSIIATMIVNQIQRCSIQAFSDI